MRTCMFARLLIAILALVWVRESFADDCAGVIALSRLRTVSISSQAEVQSNASNFCSAYSSYKSTGSTTSFGASYDFLAATFSNSNVSYDQVASKYCSAASGYSAAADAYSAYIDSIAPGAYDAYKSCVEHQRGGVHFVVDPSSVLPTEFNMTVTFDPAGQHSAQMFVKPSSGVTCTWSDSRSTTASFASPSSRILSCNRVDANARSFVTVARADDVDNFTMPWQAYTREGVPIDAVEDLRRAITSVNGRVGDNEKQIASLQAQYGSIDFPADPNCGNPVSVTSSKQFAKPFPSGVHPSISFGLIGLHRHRPGSNYNFSIGVTKIDGSGFTAELTSDGGGACLDGASFSFIAVP